MDEQQRRTQAISLYLQGKHPNTNCKSLGRSRPWLYKWLKVYDPSNPHWARSQSRTPQRSPKKTAQAIVQLVCTIRKRLVKTKYAQKGAVAIQWQLEQLGVCPVPAIWTINRILKREGLLVKPIYRPRSTAYPNLQATAPNVAHQMDLVGPRYLKSKERFYGIHLIDIFSNAWSVHTAKSRRPLPKSFLLHRKRLPWREGKISFIRLTDHTGAVHFFSERFEIATNLCP
jgi:putative transposase